MPTAPQLAYYESEVRALIHFNMATFIKDGDPGCNADNWNTHKPYAAGKASDPTTFNPTKLNFSNWLESFRAVGIQNAVMTAKHGCGHLLWYDFRRKATPLSPSMLRYLTAVRHQHM